MTDALKLAADHGDFVAHTPPAPKPSAEGAGLVPLEYKVLVHPSAAEVDPALARAKAAGLTLPQEVLDKELAAQVVATLLATGGNAFEDWKDPKPKVGDRVLIGKYAGIGIRGADGLEYRVINDKDVAGIITRDGVGRL
jgi:co-chaperonin GroES (HSP10)